MAAFCAKAVVVRAVLSSVAKPISFLIRLISIEPPGRDVQCYCFSYSTDRFPASFGADAARVCDVSDLGQNARLIWKNLRHLANHFRKKARPECRLCALGLSRVGA